MITTFRSSTVHAADRLVDIMSLNHAQLHQCAWLAELERSAERHGHTATGATATDRGNRMPQLTQIGAAAHALGWSYAAAIEQFASETASNLLDEMVREPAGIHALPLSVPASLSATYTARARLFARALTRLQSSTAPSHVQPGEAAAPTTAVTTAHTVHIRVPSPPTANAVTDKDPQSPCTQAASFSGGESEVDLALEKPHYMVVYTNDPSLSEEWLREHLTRSTHDAHQPHTLHVASIALLEALATLVPHAATDERAADALMLFYNVVLLTPTPPSSVASAAKGTNDFAEQVLLPALYLLPLLPWRPHHLAALSALLTSDSLCAKIASLAISSRRAHQSETTATTTVHVQMEVWGPLAAVVPPPVPSALGPDASNSMSPAPETDSEGFFEIPETGVASSAPHSLEDDAEYTDVETSEEEEEEVEEGVEVEGMEEEAAQDEDDFEDASEDPHTDEDLAVTDTALSHGDYSFGQGNPADTTTPPRQMTSSTAPATGPYASPVRDVAGTVKPTRVSALAATGPVQRVTVEVERVAEGLAHGVADATAPSSSRLSLLVSPLPPLPSSAATAGTPTDVTAPAAIAVPLVPGERVSCEGPCRVVAAAPATVSAASTTSTLLLEASLSISLRLPGCESEGMESVSQEVVAAFTVAQSIVATRLMSQAKREMVQWSSKSSSTAADSSGSADRAAAAALEAPCTEISDILGAGLKKYATEEAAALATKAATEASAALTATSDEDIRRHVRCLTADVPAVRSALRIAAYMLWPCISTAAEGTAVIDWQKKAWKDVLRRAHGMSTSLGHCTNADSLAQFILDEVMPSDGTNTPHADTDTTTSGFATTPKQVMSQINKLFTASPTRSPEELRQALERRHATAVSVQHALTLVTALVVRQPTIAAALLVQLLTIDASRPERVASSASSSPSPASTSAAVRGHPPFHNAGCGMRLEAAVSRTVHTLVCSIVDALCRTLDALLPLSGHTGVGKCSTAPNSTAPCGVLASPPEASFLILALSLLVMRRDARDAVMADAKRCELLLELLPGGASLNVTPSLPSAKRTLWAEESGPLSAVEADEGSSFALSAALGQLAVKGELTDNGSEMFEEAASEVPSAGDIGIPPVGPLQYLSSPSSASVEVAHLPKIAKIRSSEPVMYPGTYRLYERVFDVYFHLQRLHTTSTTSSDGALWFGLTALPPSRSAVELLNDTKAMLVRPCGLAHVNGHTFPFPPFGEGDVISFQLARNSEGLEASIMEPCVVVVSLNGVEVLTLPAPKDRLYLVVASPEEVCGPGVNSGIVGVRLSPTTVDGVLPLAFAHHALRSGQASGMLAASHSSAHTSATNPVPPPIGSTGAPTTAATQPQREEPMSPPTLLKALGVASHVLQYLLVHAHHTVTATLSGTTSIIKIPTTSHSTMNTLKAPPAQSETEKRPSAEAMATQWLQMATTPLTQRARYLVQCLEAQTGARGGGVDATWHRHASDRRAMSTWVAARYRRQLTKVLLDATVNMLCVVLRDNGAAVEAASALADIVASAVVPDAIRCVALASLLTAVQACASGSAGFGLLALDPRKLWSACVPLAASVHAPGYRPRFSTSSVDYRIAVAAGGRRVEYKTPTGPGTQPCVNYAEEGIPLNGSLGSDVVTFSARLQRGYKMDSLCRHYHIGVAGCRPQVITTILQNHPGDRSRQFSTYTLSDYFNDAPEATRAELRRHHQHWMTSDIVYGCGDVITVVVHVRRRTVGFARNGKYLGTLYRNISPSVNVLFPYVELINRDSKAKWMHPVRELALYARSMMRAMLAVWWSELTPKLAELLEKASQGDSTGLAILGSDGNELSMVYRTPPPSDGVPLIQHVRLVRMDGAFALVEPESSVGTAAAGLRRVWAAALEPLFTAELPSAPPVAPFVDRLLKVVRTMAPCESRSSSATSAFVLHPGAFLRALRLLSTVTVPRESEAATGGPAAEREAELALRKDMQQFVHFLIWLLQARSTYVSVDVALIEAFNEALWLPRDDAFVPLTFAASPITDIQHQDEAGEEPGVGLAATPTTAADMLPMLCPDCGEPWETCTAGHTPPESVAELCDRVLRRLGKSSPFTGWLTSWTSCSSDRVAAVQATRPPAVSHVDTEEDQNTSHGSAESGAHHGADLDGHDVDAEDDAEEPVPEEPGNTDGNYPVVSATVLRVYVDEANGAALRMPCQCKYGNFDTVISARSATLLKGRVTFQQSGWVDDAATGVPDGEWSCEACTFVNEPGATRCAMCTTARPGAVWTCSTCTYAFNPNSSRVCETCGQLRYAGLTRLIGRIRDECVSFCEVCHASEDHGTFRSLRRRRFCTACAKVTTWLPKHKYVGTVELCLGERGDTADLVLHVDRAVVKLTDLRASSYTTAQLAALVEASDPHTPLARYVLPIAALRNAASTSGSTGDESPEESTTTRTPSSSTATSAIATPRRTESYTRTAIIYYTSLITLKWAPLMNTNIFMSPAVLQRVRIFDESWLTSLDDLSAVDAKMCMQACFKVLFFGAPLTSASSSGATDEAGGATAQRADAVPEVHTVATAAAVARALLLPRPSLRPLRSALLYALARIAAAAPADITRRNVCTAAITKLFEDAPLSPINVRCLSPIHPLRPMVPGQRRAIIFSQLHGAQLDSALTSTTSVCCLVKSLDCMTRKAPVPAVLDMDVTTALPYVVALAETTLNEAGDLQVGQIRGSLGVAPTTGGKYYYEVVLPSNFGDGTSNTIVMGWGTQQHEHLSSTQHVGSDLHSWGFNCRDRLRLMMTEQPVPTSQTPTAGDVIGSMMDLNTMMVCWTINGEEVMWVSVPSQGASEQIYPYVSASVDPCGVEIRLAYTQFRPAEYQDYTPASTDALWGQSSHTAPPQSHDFYRQLCVFLSEAGITELGTANTESISATLASSRKAQQELHMFPVIRAVVQPGVNVSSRGSVDGDDAPSDVEWARLNPYVTHLRGINDLAVRVTQVFSSVTASPFLNATYDKARDLFLSSVRWTLFESQLGIRPTFSSRPPMTVEIDLEKAKSALQRSSESARFVHDPATRFRDSVTGQLFAQTKLSKIYKNAAMFAVKVAGDVAVDGGGVTRSVLSMIADELTFQAVAHERVDPAVPLFKLCGHSTIFTVVPNMELILGDAYMGAHGGASADVGGRGSGEGLDEATDVAEATPLTAYTAATAQQRQEQAEQALQALTWLGRLIGNLTLCGTLKLPLVFPRLVWKFLTFKEVTIEDYFYDIDDTVRGALEDEDFLLDDDLFYTIPGVSRRGSDDPSALSGLLGPSSAEVSSAAAGAGASLTEIKQNATGIYALASGVGPSGYGTTASHTTNLSTNLPRGLTCGVSVAALSALHAATAGRAAVPGGLRQARFLTPAASMQNMSRIMTAMSTLDDMEDAQGSVQAEELKQRLESAQQGLLHQFDHALEAIRTGLTSVIPTSALQSIRWDDLQNRVCGSAHCSADQILSSMDCTRIPDDLKRMLATVLDDLDDKQRSLFLLFCAGQSRLPLPEKISVICGDDAAQLPTAHTCSPISLRLQPYASVRELRQKLEVSLQHAGQFGFV